MPAWGYHPVISKVSYKMFSTRRLPSLAVLPEKAGLVLCRQTDWMDRDYWIASETFEFAGYCQYYAFTVILTVIILTLSYYQYHTYTVILPVSYLHCTMVQKGGGHVIILFSRVFLSNTA